MVHGLKKQHIYSTFSAVQRILCITVICTSLPTDFPTLQTSKPSFQVWGLALLQLSWEWSSANQWRCAKCLQHMFVRAHTCDIVCCHFGQVTPFWGQQSYRPVTQPFLAYSASTGYAPVDHSVEVPCHELEEGAEWQYRWCPGETPWF